MLLTLYDRNNNQKMILSPSESSTQQKAIQSDNLLSLSFVFYECIALEVNDYIDFNGERFWITDRYTPEQKSSVEWEYNIKLYGIESLIKRYLVVKLINGSNEPEFSYTATAYDHVSLIVQNINAGMETSDWKVGEVVTSEYLDVDYEGTYCDEGLKKVADLAGVEYWIEGTTINVSRCEHSERITLGYDKGLTSLYSDKADNVKFFTRLFPIGGTRNIAYDDYGHSRLQLPSGVKYIDQDTDKFGVVHHYEKEAFAHIYPRRIGKISNVRSEQVKGEDGNPFIIYYFKDSSLNFNPNDYEMNGLVKQVSFQDNSSLAGRDFEVDYNAKTKEFEIITQWPYNNDIQLPNEQISPKVLDDYILWNIKMPTEYYSIAEEEYRDAVKRYMTEQRKDVTVYKAHTDYIDIAESNLNITLGQRVRLEHSEYFTEGYRDSRITKITRKVARPTDMDIEISDALSRGALESIKDRIDEVTDNNNGNIKKLHKETMQITERRYRDALETMYMLRNALLDNFTNSITPISIQAMQLLLGDDSLQFIFTTSKTNPDSNILTPNFVFDKNDASKFKVSFKGEQTVYLQHKTLGITSLSSSHSNFKTWKISEFISQRLTDESKSYYLYAIVSTSNFSDMQIFDLSEEAIGINEVNGYYHLLVGILNREVNNERSFSSFYGFSELTPGRFTVPLISSPSGKTYFDLVGDEIGGRINFIDGLISGNVALWDKTGVISSYFSGNRSKHAIALGVSNYETNGEIAMTVLNHDGSASFANGKLGWDSKGNTFGDFGRFYLNGFDITPKLSVYEVKKDTSNQDYAHFGNVLTTSKGIVMFSADDSGSGSIFDSIPLASTTNKGLSQFDPGYFTAVGGMVSLRDDLDFGLNITELQAYLSSAQYTTKPSVELFVKTWVSQADKDSWNGKLNKSTFDEFFTISGEGDNRVITANFPLFSTGSMCMFSVTADGGGGIGGGVANLSELLDVSLGTLSEGQILMYNLVSGKWKNAPKPAYSWSEISAKPSWIGASKPTYSWSEISAKPDLVLTSDSRLSNARQASDVSAWAKATNKPTYSWGEVTGKPALLNIDPTGGINNSTATNGIWFDYNFAGTSRAGSVISGSGLSGGFPVQLFGDYQTGNIFYLRTRHGDNNTWNPPKLIWHDGNSNRPNVEWNAANILLPTNGSITINGKRTLTSDASGDTYLGGVDTGTNNTILRTNGVERLRITSDGKIGIGTSSPTTTLEVNGVAKLGQQPWRAIIGSSSTTNDVTYGVSDSNNTHLTYIRMGANKLQFNPNAGSNNYNIWHAGNSNLSTVDWNCQNLNIEDGSNIRFGGKRAMVFGNGSDVYMGGVDAGMGNTIIRRSGTAMLTLKSGVVECVGNVTATGSVIMFSV